MDIDYEFQWDTDPTLSSPSSKTLYSVPSTQCTLTTIQLGSTPAEAENIFYWRARTLNWWNADYIYKKKITISTGSTAAPTSTSVSLTLDHAQLVTDGKSLSSGNDVRIVYWNGSIWIELDRNNETAFNTSNTEIWFNLQADIPANSNDDDYYIYYGNSTASSPPTDVKYYKTLILQQGVDGYSGCVDSRLRSIL